MKFEIHKEGAPDIVLETPFSISGNTADFIWLATVLSLRDSDSVEVSENGWSLIMVDTDEDWRRFCAERKKLRDDSILEEAERIKSARRWENP